MTALAVAGILGGGFADSLGQLARSPWALIPLGVALAMGAAIWYLGRRSRTVPFPREEVIDDALPRFFERKPQAAPWPDGDTVITDGLTAELERLLKGDGRDG